MFPLVEYLSTHRRPAFTGWSGERRKVAGVEAVHGDLEARVAVGQVGEHVAEVRGFIAGVEEDQGKNGGAGRGSRCRMVGA
jgi:hypothetical protein